MHDLNKCAPRSLRSAIRPVGFAITWAAVVSLGVNLLMLVAPIYLMQVFDRVLTSGNLNTLLWLTVVAVGSLAVFGALTVVRGRILSKVGIWLECEATGWLVRAGLAEARNGDGQSTQGLRDLAHIRSFLSGPAICALFDAPWSVVFLIVLAALHPWYGIFGAASAVALLSLALISELMTRRLSRVTNDSRTSAMSGIEAALHNSEVVHALGMTDAVLARWNRAQTDTARQQDSLNDYSALFGGLSKFFRMAVQIGILGVGAVLVISGEATAGTMIAASVMMGRALAPVDQGIACWNQIKSARLAWHNVDRLLASTRPERSLVRLPEPQGRLQVENATLRLGDTLEPQLKNVSFELAPGESLAVVGPSAAGKSMVCRLVTGILSPTSGNVRLDHADLADWPQADLRPHVGYLPQDVALFPGTVSENISRLGEADSHDIIAAAQLAGVHELILRLPDGYQTDIGAFGHLLSGGQRQRIGLARAVFGNPRLVVLDEPNSNLDPEGEAALLRAFAELRRRGCTVVTVSHKLSLVQEMDKTLFIQEGAVQTLGPSQEVLSVLMGETHRPKAQLAATGD